MKTNNEILESIDNSIIMLACRKSARKDGEEIESIMPKYDAFESTNTKKVRRALLKNKTKKNIKLLLKKAPMVFSILFAMVLVFSACALSSPAVMRSIGNFVLDKYETHTNINVDGDKDTSNFLTEGYFFPTYIPEGYVLLNFNIAKGGLEATYASAETENDFNYIVSNSNTEIMIDNENADEYIEKQFFGGEYIYVKKGDHSTCVFLKDMIVYTTDGNLSNVECQKIIESLKIKIF